MCVGVHLSDRIGDTPAAQQRRLHHPAKRPIGARPDGPPVGCTRPRPATGQRAAPHPARRMEQLAANTRPAAATTSQRLTSARPDGARLTAAHRARPAAASNAQPKRPIRLVRMGLGWRLTRVHEQRPPAPSTPPSGSSDQPWLAARVPRGSHASQRAQTPPSGSSGWALGWRLTRICAPATASQRQQNLSGSSDGRWLTANTRHGSDQPARSTPPSGSSGWSEVDGWHARAAATASQRADSPRDWPGFGIPSDAIGR